MEGGWEVDKTQLNGEAGISQCRCSAREVISSERLLETNFMRKVSELAWMERRG